MPVCRVDDGVAGTQPDMTPSSTTTSGTAAPSTAAAIARGALAGEAGTAVMTAFQVLVEMPLTRRPPSYAPADLVEAVLPVHPTTALGRTRLNWAAHFGLGSVWGAAHGLVTRAGLRGQRAVHAVFAVLYPVDVLVGAALGVYHPRRWTAMEWVVDAGNKYVAVQATGLVHDRFLDPAR